MCVLPDHPAALSPMRSLLSFYLLTRKRKLTLAKQGRICNRNDTTRPFREKYELLKKLIFEFMGSIPLSQNCMYQYDSHDSRMLGAGSNGIYLGELLRTEREVPSTYSFSTCPIQELEDCFTKTMILFASPKPLSETKKLSLTPELALIDRKGFRNHDCFSGSGIRRCARCLVPVPIDRASQALLQG